MEPEEFLKEYLDKYTKITAISQAVMGQPDRMRPDQYPAHHAFLLKLNMLIDREISIYKKQLGK